MSGGKGMQHYPVETKREAVGLVEEEHQTYASVASQLGIRKAERIEVWVRMYRKEGEASFQKPIGRAPKAQAEQRALERLRMENALRKKFSTELRELRLAQGNIGRSTTHKEESEVRTMCEFFCVSRAAYYAWERKLGETEPDQERMEQVQAAYEGSHKTYGYRRLTLHLQKKMGLWINHKAVLRLMHKLGIRSCARKPKLYKKLEDLGTYHRYPNVLNRDFVAAKPNQKWVTDVTYIRTQPAWAYLSTIKDLFDGFIAQHVLELNNSIALVTQTLKQAKQKEKVTDGLILHSDQGTQYTSQAYHVLTTEYNITPSMSRRGNCWDNAPMENFFGHLKEEYLRHFKQPTLKKQNNSSANTFTFTTIREYN